MLEQTALVYDESCAFCRRCLAWAQSNLKNLPRMVPSGRSEIVGVTSAEARSSVWLIDANKRYAGHRAVGRVFTGQTGLWKLLGYLILGLGPISALGYSLVAANRHRLPGGTKECVLIHD